jgi:ATP phosphoribosyltransferase
MQELILDSGEKITDELQILAELTKFYKTLYKSDNGFEEEQTEALDEMMSKLEELLTPDQLKELECTPTIDELEKTMKLLASNKAPGSDGLTAEILRNCWEFMKEDILGILQEFWDTESLYEELLQGIIR